MYLRKHETADGPRWSFDGRFLPRNWRLQDVLQVKKKDALSYLSDVVGDTTASGPVLAPIDDGQELWASGVTYVRSREARRTESHGSDFYDYVYAAERPELFMKAVGWRVAGSGAELSVRGDSNWNVPEPELALVINRHLEIVGFTIGNDVSSRSIEGENPLYLPQAKMFDGASALGPAILVATDGPATPTEFTIEMSVEREGVPVFQGRTSTRDMKRTFDELVRWLGAHLTFPHGVILMTGTGIVPEDAFSLGECDVVRITATNLGVLENAVRSKELSTT